MTQPTQDKRIYTLSQERPAKAVVKMGVPLTCGMLIMVLYNLTDTFFIGMLRDDYQLAAVNLAYPVMMITIAVSNMVGTGGSTLIARCLGAKDEEKANHTLTSAFLLTIATGACRRILGEGESAVSDWKRALRAGSTVTPLEFAQMAGVDISTDGPLLAAIEYIGSMIDEMWELTEKLGF